MRRVVVTGLGAVTPVGNDIPAMWNALLAGKSGVGPRQEFRKLGKCRTDAFRCAIVECLFAC